MAGDDLIEDGLLRPAALVPFERSGSIEGGEHRPAILPTPRERSCVGAARNAWGGSRPVRRSDRRPDPDARRVFVSADLYGTPADQLGHGPVRLLQEGPLFWGEGNPLRLERDPEADPLHRNERVLARRGPGISAMCRSAPRELQGRVAEDDPGVEEVLVVAEQGTARSARSCWPCGCLAFPTRGVRSTR